MRCFIQDVDWVAYKARMAELDKDAPVARLAKRISRSSKDYGSDAARVAEAYVACRRRIAKLIVALEEMEGVIQSAHNTALGDGAVHIDASAKALDIGRAALAAARKDWSSGC